MKYDIIYADPPWPQHKGGLRKTRPNQDRRLDYPILNVDEIEKILGSYDGREFASLRCFYWQER